ncbi:hypothetical protein V6N11_012811 [Hibiscus sabdariffa]|uniref:Uncharacterized protein n=2 Tax=Hibiscus sabdariffa TaxID=183260 RepID=A0ABR2BQX8_9ROSI
MVADVGWFRAVRGSLVWVRVRLGFPEDGVSGSGVVVELSSPSGQAAAAVGACNPSHLHSVRVRVLGCCVWVLVFGLGRCRKLVESGLVWENWVSPVWEGSSQGKPESEMVIQPTLKPIRTEI